MPSMKHVVAFVLPVAAYYLLVEVPAPKFPVHSSGAIVVSGASSGIGLDASIGLAKHGFTVFAGVRKEADKAAVIADCNSLYGTDVCVRVVPVILDVTKQETIDSTFETVKQWMKEHKQPFVALVNNAGVSTAGVVELTPLSKYRDLFEVNYFGVVALTQKFLPLVRESKGRVINVSSGFGVLAIGARSAYCSTKFALEGFTDSLRKEMLPLDVAVSLINPGVVKTKIIDKHEVRIASTHLDEQAMSLYGRYYKNELERTKSAFASAPTTEVTTDAILDATVAVSPKTRYYVSGAGPIPVSVAAFLARVLPTNLFDRLMEAVTTAK